MANIGWVLHKTYESNNDGQEENGIRMIDKWRQFRNGNAGEQKFLKNELLRERKDETDGLGNSSRKKYLLV